MSNYGGKQPNTSAYVKRFNISNNANTWVYSNGINGLLLQPTNSAATVYIKGDLYVGGSVNNPSDFKLKNNIETLSLSLSENIMNLNPVKYNYKDDEKGKEHFGFIAQEVEQYMPNLVNTISQTDANGEDKSFKTVNYIEMIPILLLKIKDLQKQIDQLNSKISEK